MTAEITPFATGQAPWIPVAHRMELFHSDVLPTERDLITAAFVLLTDLCNRVLLTHVNLPGRGWDVPGGHVDASENPAESAAREVAEETGFAVRSDVLRLAGWQRFTLLARPPDWYHYPFPLSYTVMYTAKIGRPGPPARPPAGSECGPAEWCTIEEVAQRCSRASWLPFVAGVAGISGKAT